METVVIVLLFIALIVCLVGIITMQSREIFSLEDEKNQLLEKIQNLEESTDEIFNLRKYSEEKNGGNAEGNKKGR